MISKTLLLALLSLIMYTTMALRLSFTSPTVKRSQVHLFAEREADFVKAVKKSTVVATLLAVGMFAGVMPGHASYVLESPFNSILVPTFLTKITLPGFRVDFHCPDSLDATATATVRQNVAGGINKATITSDGSKTDYVPGSKLACKTKSIDVIADTQLQLIGTGGKITLISGEITPNLPYSEPVKNTYIAERLDGERLEETRFTTLEEAQTSCSKDAACTGVTKEIGTRLPEFTKRKGYLKPSPGEEISWVKIAASSGQALPWIINIVDGDFTIFKK